MVVNSVALAFILQIDELLCSELMPGHLVGSDMDRHWKTVGCIDSLELMEVNGMACWKTMLVEKGWVRGFPLPYGWRPSLVGWRPSLGVGGHR